MNLIYLMNHILFQIFKIISNLSLKNKKLWQIIHQYKFLTSKLKIMLYSFTDQNNRRFKIEDFSRIISAGKPKKQNKKKKIK